jgi:hypothetical protein
VTNALNSYTDNGNLYSETENLVGNSVNLKVVKKNTRHIRISINEKFSSIKV